MKIVIDIPDEEYENVKKASGCYNFGEAIVNGTPLPKGHGRLIDADDLSSISVGCDSFGCLKKIYAPVIIEASEEGAVG